MHNDSVERQGVHLTGLRAEQSGMIFRELPTSDEGIDAQLELRNSESRGTGRLIAAQIKAGPSYFSEQSDQHVVFRPSERHVSLWRNHSVPVVIFLCNVEKLICYWQTVSEETCVSTGKGWRIDIPLAQTLISAEPFERLASLVPAASEFSIASTKDHSHNKAKRVSLEIVTSIAEQTTKAKIASIVRAAVMQGRASDYARDEVVEEVLGDKEADMVSGYVYLREIDRLKKLWVCRFQWTSPGIDPSARYEGVDGELDSEGLYIEWQLDQTMARLIDQSRSTKGIYLKHADQVVGNCRDLHGRLHQFLQGGCQVEDRAELAKLASGLSDRWNNGPTPPTECQRLDDEINLAVSLLGNMEFIWGPRSKYTDQAAEHVSRDAEVAVSMHLDGVSFLRREVS